MGGQVLDHADVGDPSGERALPPGDDLVDLAELALGQPRPQALQRGVVALDVSDPADQAARLEGLDEPARTFDAGGQRLLDQRADARLGELHADVLVQWPSGSRDDDVVEAQRDAAPRRSRTIGAPWATRVSVTTASAAPTKSTPSSSDRMRAWLRPIAPSPTRPARRVTVAAPASLTPATTRSSSSGVRVGMHRQGERLESGSLGLGQVPARVRCAGLGEERLQAVDGRRVVRRAADALVGEACLEPVAVPGADRVLVVDVAVAVGDRRHDNAGELGVEALGVGPPLLGPLVEPSQLVATDRRGDVGHARVGADDLVGVTLLHALVAQQPERAAPAQRRRW